jgi:hypothetical protein
MTKRCVWLGELALVAALVVYACTKGPTAPEPVAETPSPVTVGQPAVAPSPVPTPTPAPTPTPDPKTTQSYITLNADGSGVFCAVRGSNNVAYLIYTPPYSASPVYGSYATARIADGTCTDIPPANRLVRFPWCGTKKVQVDANRLGFNAGGHMGHIVATVESSETCCVPKYTETSETVYGPWSECKAANSLVSCVTCSRHRTKTVTTYKVNSCTGEKVKTGEKVTIETEACTCPKG